MGIYTFRNKEDNTNIITLEMSMADREAWLANNPDFEQIIVSCNIADPAMLGILAPEVKDFNRNVIGRMADAIPGNNLRKQSRFNQNIGEV